MKPLHILVLSVFLGVPAVAAQEVPLTVVADVPAETQEQADGLLIIDAAGVTLDEFHWVKRPVLVFADSPADPQFQRQMELVRRDTLALAERDVVVITDTDPAAMGYFRTRFRPRGFGLVLMDKDGVTTLRKPLPWDVREISRAIDKWPMRRQEILERYPSGR
ncbi:MAG: DUF4174 domain-containing protein [Gemmobacter sp.]